MIIPLLQWLVSFVLPAAQAKNIETLGVGAPGIAPMWQVIKATFPHTNVGAGGVTFLALKIIDFILKSIGALAVIMIIYAGIRMIAQGEEGLTEGKKIIMYAVIGLIAALCADAVVIFAQVLVSEASQ
jgi:hypothetical protein